MEFRCSENMDKVLNAHYFFTGSSKDNERVDGRFVMKNNFNQQMEFQRFKIIQDFKKVYIRRFFVFFFFFFFCLVCSH